jgi:putative sterol carrier protein
MAEITTAELFAQMPSVFHPDVAGDLVASFQFNLSGAQGGAWWVKVENGVATSGAGAIANPDVTIVADAEDYINVALGKMNVAMAFMQGKLKVQGDLGLAARLPQIFHA